MKSIEELFQDYLLERYPTLVLTHDELIRLRDGYFSGFSRAYNTMDARTEWKTPIPLWSEELGKYRKLKEEK